MTFPRLSLTFRLTLLFAVISTTVLLLLGLLIGRAVEQHFVEEDMVLMMGKLRLAGNLLEKVQTNADVKPLAAQLADALVGHHGLAMRVAAADGGIWFSTEAPFPDVLLDRARTRNPPLPQTWRHGSSATPWRGVAALMPTAAPGSQAVLVSVAIDITHHEIFMTSFQRTLWLCVIFAAALAGFLGWVAVRRGLAPLESIRAGVASVTANRLDYRLAVDAVPIELAVLANTLNAMLLRLEESFQRLKDFSSDLAHELRTPVSNLMTVTQVALSRARSPEEYRDVLASNTEEFERLTRMIGDMLFLAEADNGRIVPNRLEVMLHDEVRQLFDFFDALAEEKALTFSLIGSGVISGDRLMLRRALANLLSNAIRHTPHGGRIQVRINAADEGLMLSVENTGEPIAPQHLPRIFDRFYRADPSRHRSGEGVGLGLAITRSIILAHGGEIGVRTTADGVCFDLRMV